MSEPTFDYIVVGAGSAGGQLVTELTRSGQHRVLLIEAGGSHKDLKIDMPAGWGALGNDPKFSWGHWTEPEPMAHGRRVSIPRGRVLGGSSSINGMIYIRGQESDYARWVEEGAHGWSWEELLPDFIATEHQLDLRGDAHGTGGSLTAASLRTAHPVSRAMVEAARSAGLAQVEDFNRGTAEGCGLYQVNVREGRRDSIARRALEPALSRANLELASHALVDCVLFSGKRAVGVRYRRSDGSLTEAHARVEVIVCAGSLETPGLLMRSGVGPSEQLQALGIPVVNALAGVGQNLQDHAVIPMAFRLRAGTPSLNPSFRGLGLIKSVLQYLLLRRGPMTTPPAEFGGYFRSDPSLPHTDVQVFGLPVTGDIESVLKGKQPTTEAQPGLTLAPYQVRPWSRGSIELVDRHPQTLPRIRVNYLSDPRDQVVVVSALRWLRGMTAQPALASLIDHELQPGSERIEDAALLDWAGHVLTTGHHPVGTCRMGHLGDRLSVVDAELRVIGLEGLRVADASVMPSLISGNTNATSVVIGHRAARLLAQSAQGSSRA
jgi:choline dehydrogenase